MPDDQFKPVAVEADVWGGALSLGSFALSGLAKSSEGGEEGHISLVVSAEAWDSQGEFVLQEPVFKSIQRDFLPRGGFLDWDHQYPTHRTPRWIAGHCTKGTERMLPGPPKAVGIDAVLHLKGDPALTEVARGAWTIVQNGGILGSSIYGSYVGTGRQKQRGGVVKGVMVNLIALTPVASCPATSVVRKSLNDLIADAPAAGPCNEDACEHAACYLFKALGSGSQGTGADGGAAAVRESILSTKKREPQSNILLFQPGLRRKSLRIRLENEAMKHIDRGVDPEEAVTMAALDLIGEVVGLASRRR